MIRAMLMSGFSMTEKNLSRKDAGFTITRIFCTCGPKKSNPMVVGGQLFCKCCQRPYSYEAAIDNNTYPTMDDLVASLVPVGKVSGDVNNDGIRCELERANNRINEQESAIRELEQKLQAAIDARDVLARECDSLRIVIEGKEQRICDIEEGYRAELERMKGEIESSRSELGTYKEQVDLLKIRVSDSEQFIQDLKETNNHSQMELAKMKTLDVRGIVTSVLEYAASVNNSVLDGSDAGAIKETTEARTEKLIMNLSRHGIKVRRHNRGDSLGDERIDVVEKGTDSPELDMTVARSLNYGASFRDDILAMIPEVVSVYRFREKPSDDVE